MSEHDWLDNTNTDVRDDQKALAVQFAQNYSIFVTDPRGVAILEHWNKTLLRKRTPTSASIQEYAADEAVRAFIGGITTQIELAKEGS